MKKYIIILFLLSFFNLANAEENYDFLNKVTETFDSQCFKNFWEIKNDSIEKEYIKIEKNDLKDLTIIQNNFFLPYTLVEKNINSDYRNEYWIKEILSNDNNDETYLVFDTLESKELILELDEILEKNTFKFNLAYETSHYLINLEISDDWENYQQVNRENIIDYDVKYIKLIAFCEKFTCIRERIKIFELNFIKTNKYFLLKSIFNEDIKIFSEYTCEENIDNIKYEDTNFYEIEKIDSQIIELNLSENTISYTEESSDENEISEENIFEDENIELENNEIEKEENKIVLHNIYQEVDEEKLKTKRNSMILILIFVTIWFFVTLHFIIKKIKQNNF